MEKNDKVAQVQQDKSIFIGDGPYANVPSTTLQPGVLSQTIVGSKNSEIDNSKILSLCRCCREDVEAKVINIKISEYSVSVILCGACKNDLINKIKEEIRG